MTDETNATELLSDDHATVDTAPVVHDGECEDECCQAFCECWCHDPENE